MKPIRIVVVDDSLTIRAMIETLLERDRRVQVVGIARNGGTHPIAAASCRGAGVQAAISSAACC
tara:strand:- start:286 stop:477 length:192 start_codon:yes stop_codon:yes gene_type:complete